MARVSAEDREKTAIKSGPGAGSYPLATEAQCISAVRLRWHGKAGHAVVMRHIARALKRHPEWRRCKAAYNAARERDRLAGRK